jgi:hypothetical protein
LGESGTEGLPFDAMTYAVLKADIASWLHRADLTTELATFVRLSETDISNDARVRSMETVVTGSVSAGAISMPSNLIESRLLVVDGYPKDYSTPRDFAELGRINSEKHVYTVTGASIKVLTGSSYSLTYWAALDALSADSDTNWLLQNAYDVYLWAGIKQAAIWAQDDQATMKYDAMYRGAVAKINAREAKAMRGGTLTIRPALGA